jgi:hypothetical protein
MTCGTVEFAPLIMWVVPVTLAQQLSAGARRSNFRPPVEQQGDWVIVRRANGRKRRGLAEQLQAERLDQGLEQMEKQSIEVSLSGRTENVIAPTSFPALIVEFES